MNLLNIIKFETPVLGIMGIILSILWALDYYAITGNHFLHFHPSFYSIIRPIRWFKHLLFLLGLSCWLSLSFIASSPYQMQAKIKNQTYASDVYFVLDVSLSMLATDYYPNRLEKAKQRLKDIISKMDKARIGLIIFSEKIQTLVPLTEDISFVLESIDKIQVGPLGAGTNIGDALLLAINRLEFLKTSSKMIILLTDGVAQVGQIHPLKASIVANEKNIKIYSIGMGLDANARLPNNRLIPGGSADMALLQQMANNTNAKAFEGHDDKALMDSFNSITKRENIYYDEQSNIIKNYSFGPYFLYIIIMLMLVDLIKRIGLKEYL